MKFVGEKYARGRRLVTVELGVGEELIGVMPDSHYRLGGQHDDIVPSHVLTETVPVSWCHISQKWEE